MLIEVNQKNDCSDCVFCQEGIYCGLLDGEHIDYDYENNRMVASFCPIINPEMRDKITDKVKLVK